MRMPQTHPFLPCARSLWIVNYGLNAAVSGVALGAASLRNATVSVTSWGYTDTNIKVQGASWFGQNVEFPQAAYGGRGEATLANWCMMPVTTLLSVAGCCRVKACARD